MSSSPPAIRRAFRWTALLPRLRVVVVIAVVASAIGMGAYSAMNRKVEVIDDSELDGITELATGERPDTASPQQTRPRASAKITDVVAAVHRDDADGPSRVQMAGYENDTRPDTKSPVWLIGTIEDSTPSPSDAQQDTAPAPFRRFSR